MYLIVFFKLKKYLNYDKFVDPNLRLVHLDLRF